MHPTDWSQGLAVEVGGRDVVSHVGTAVVRLLADRVGLTGRLSEALAEACPTAQHDRGRVLTDVAVGIADGGTRIKDIDTLGDQEELFGPVASVPTAWRTLKDAGENRLEACDSRAFLVPGPQNEHRKRRPSRSKNPSILT